MENLDYRKKCGEKYGKLCSEAFGENYTTDDIRAILHYLSRTRDYWKAFEDFPRDPDSGRFEPKFFSDFSKGIHEHIHNILVRNETRQPRFAHTNLLGFIYRTIFNFLHEEKRTKKNYRELAVNEDMLHEIRLMLDRPTLLTQDLYPLGKKPLSVQAETLLHEIREIPGYNSVWFRTRNRDGDRELTMFVPQDDLLGKLLFVTTTSHDDPIRDHFRDNLKDFYTILSEREKCVLRYRILEHYSQLEVVDLCWKKPVKVSRVNHVIHDIVKKAKKYFGVTDDPE